MYFYSDRFTSSVLHPLHRSKLQSVCSKCRDCFSILCIVFIELYSRCLSLCFGIFPRLPFSCLFVCYSSEADLHLDNQKFVYKYIFTFHTFLFLFFNIFNFHLFLLLTFLSSIILLPSMGSISYFFL